MLISSVSLFAQNPTTTYEKQPLSTHKLNKENWNKYAEEVNYKDRYVKREKSSEKETKENQKDKGNGQNGQVGQNGESGESGETGQNGQGGQENQGENQSEEISYPSEPTSFEIVAAPIFKFLLILGVILLLVFVIIKLMNLEHLFSPKNRKVKSSAAKINLDNIEENLHESDLEGFIKQALAEKNYALAVRLYYLAILKELSLSGQIKWKKDKTNREYMREMSGKNLLPKFRETTFIFERVWYGTGILTEQIFQEIEPKFKTVLAETTPPTTNQI